MAEKELTFGGYKVKFKVIDDGEDVEITCKKLTGLLSQVTTFLNCQRNKSMMDCYFGKSLMRGEGRQVTIDCLEDTRTQIKFLYTHAKNLQNEHRSDRSKS